MAAFRQFRTQPFATQNSSSQVGACQPRKISCHRTVVAGAGKTGQPFYFSGKGVTGWISQVYALNMAALSYVFDVTTHWNDVCVQSS
jgi:hypothetical protein